MNNEKLNKIIELLISGLRPFNQIETFSDKPGIYAIGFNGDKFPLESAEDKIAKGDIIYIGKLVSGGKKGT